MQLTCPQCHETLTFAETAPKFCSNCGQALGSSKHSTIEYAPEAVTLPPPVDLEAPTLAPTAVASAGAGPVPEVIGGYKLLRTLGGGGMGTVYEAEDPHSGRHVALKVVLPQYAGSRETLERFRQEGELASSLAHPRCVFVLGADEDAGRPYIVMELMSGITLQDLVHDLGPLPPEEAIRKILDVIDGLEEAHRLGLVHRDVKPSNCFVEPDGHVKIGDFGLARSLVRDTHLTRTGTFLGTPLYSSPEQVKAEKVDAQSDVYSVAATLYFLLTGQAPFQSGDAMATLARIVSDDPPSMRTLKPQLPKALDRVVLRGLERDRKRRWKDLGEFRRALVRFLPVQPSIGDMGVRFGAFGIDWVILQITGGLWGLLVHQVKLIVGFERSEAMLSGFFGGLFWHVVYYGLFEGLWGCSVGKWFMRLRVCGTADLRAPGLLRASLRALLFAGMLTLGSMVIIVGEALPASYRVLPLDAVVILGGVTSVLSILALLLPMRARSGYRGLHEWLSGTRTVRLPWPQTVKRPSLRSRVREVHEGAPCAGLPERVGPYHVRGLVHRLNADEVLLAEELTLKRRVWVWLRPGERAPLSEATRQLNRTSRQRWLSGGKLGDRQWDAFLAPRGEPLTLLIQREGTQPWSETRLLLEHLAAELAHAEAEGTLPATLGLNQVRLLADGQIQLVETTLGAPSPDTSVQERCLAQLRQVVSLALEGQPRRADDWSRPVAAQLPGHARRILGLLAGQAQKIEPFNLFTMFRRPADLQTKPYASVAELHADLDTTQARATEVRRWHRSKHLMTQGLFILIGLLAALPIALLIKNQTSTFAKPWGVAGIALAATLAVGLVCLGNELSFRILGIRIVCSDGRYAPFWRQLVRTLFSWLFLLPLAGISFIALAVFEDPEVDDRIGFALLAVAATVLAFYVGVMIWYPTRAPHDRLVGTYLVPE